MAQTITVDVSGLVDGTLAQAADVSIPVSNLKTAVEDTLNGIQQFDQVRLNSGDLTIASDAITITKSLHYVDTEAAASTDNLATINGGSAGDILVIAAKNTAHDVVVKHGTGNIYLDGATDVTLDDDKKIIIFVYNGTNWLGKGIGGGSLSSPTPIGNVAPNTGAFTTLAGTVITASTSLNGKVNTTASGTGSSGLNIPAGTAPTSPTAGDVWNDSAANSLVAAIGGNTMRIPMTLFSSNNTKIFDTTTAETSMCPTGVGSLTIPANFIKVNKMMKCTLMGLLLYTGTPTFRVRTKIAGTTFFDVTLTMPASPAFYAFTFDFFMWWASVGGSGLMRPQGMWFQPNGSGNSKEFYPAGGYVTYDSTAAQTLDVTGTWSASSASNQSITWMMVLQSLN